MRTIPAPSRAYEAQVSETESFAFVPESTHSPIPSRTEPTPYRAATASAETLYQRHHEMVFRVCLKYLRHREEAREATQETFLKAIRALPEFEGLSQTGTWVYRIAVNECLSRIESRRRDREKREKLGEEMALEFGRHDEAETFAGRLVQEVMENVPEATRNVVWLSIGQGLTHAEIAATLGVSRVAVTRRISRFMSRAQQWRQRLVCQPEYAALAA